MERFGKKRGPIGETVANQLPEITHSIRSQEPDPLRLHTPNLPHLAGPFLLRARLPRHRPAPRASKTYVPNHVPDPIAKRSLPSERICEVYVAVWDSECGGLCVAVACDAALRDWGGDVLACQLGGAKYDWGE